MTFKQPGFSLHAGTSPAKADLLKRKNYKKVDVSGGKKTKSTREEYEAMKKAPGKPTDKLTAEYGGKWSKKGNATTYTNEEGLKPVQVASAKSRKKADQKKKYIEENTTSPAKVLADGSNIKSKKKTSKKIGPAQSPEARKKIRANVTKTRKAAEASGKSGTIFDATDKTLDANEAAMNKDREARKYVKN